MLALIIYLAWGQKGFCNIVVIVKVKIEKKKKDQLGEALFWCARVYIWL